MASWKSVVFLVVIMVLLCGDFGRAQVAWTPIYVEGNSQVDLWTVSGTGCSCPREGGVVSTSGDSSGSSSVQPNGADDCACCVRDGGCPCGSVYPRRCTQCGLEQHCVHMCNMTIDAKALQSHSGKTVGQIKSPSLVGPGSCWYLLLADRNQRIEIQVYRLVSVGHFNGTSCESGFLELSEGSDVLGRKTVVGSGGGGGPGGGKRGGVSLGSGGSSSGLQLCGENERFAPPAVLFADRSSATLLFQVGEPTLRSQFFAYFSFTPADHSTLGIPYRGGKRVEHTECDWVYQEHLCKGRGKGGRGGKGKGGGKGGGSDDGDKKDNDDAGCLLASPGHPGVYPPNRRCKYLVTTSSIRTRVNITFLSLLLPYNHCDTDYIAIYKGSTTSSPLLTTICGSRKTQVEYSGPNMLIEFSSGPPIPPYDYNGFVARLEFTEVPEEAAITETSVGVPTKTTEPVDETLGMPRHVPNTICDYMYFGNLTRSGHFDTRTKGWLQVPSVVSSSSSTKPMPVTCKLVFYGRNSDVVHLSFFNYDLRAPSCESSLEVYDGKVGKNGKSLQKICSPLTRYARDQSGRFLEQQTRVSSGNILTIVFRRSLDANKEFLDGAFLFHDERVEGTLQPSTLCDVVYDGGSRGRGSGRREGQFVEPVAGRAPQLLWNVEGPLRCSQRFDLVAGQAITLKVESAVRLGRDPHCSTRCQKSSGGGGVIDEDLGGGCSCLPNLIPLSQMDYLLILTADGSGRHVSCLCGDFQDALPLAVKSTTSLIVEYRVAHYSWTTRGFGFKASYKFEDENSCGETVKTENSGAIESKNRMKTLTPAPRNYYHESCTWLLHSHIERQLTVEVSTTDNKPCNIWNITLLQYRDNTVQEELDRTTHDRVGQVLYTFCPRQRKKTFKLPWKQSNVFVRLSSLSNSPADYSVRWKSQIVRANNRVAAPAQDSMSGKSNQSCTEMTLIIISMLYFLCERWVVCPVAT